MYSAMCSLHWLCADTSQCSQFLQQCMSTPQCGHVSARWSLTSKISSFLHLWQKCRFCSTLGTQLMAQPPGQKLRPRSSPVEIERLASRRVSASDEALPALDLTH